MQVQHTSRWGTLAEGLIEDNRLSLDTRAVAAWLAIKPPGWQIVISVLTARMNLGKERWQRVARELEAAGYLSRTCRPGIGGRWKWEIVFDAAGGRLPGSGHTDDGDADAGGDGTKEDNIPEAYQAKKNTTTTTKASGGGANLLVPDSILCHTQMLREQLTSLPIEVQQAIVDEFVGVLDAVARGEHVAIRSPRAWIASLVKAAKVGEFMPEWGERGRRTIKANFANAENLARADAQAAEERAQAGLPTSQSKDDALAALNKILGKGRGMTKAPTKPDTGANSS